MAAGAGVFYNYTRDMECFDYKAGANEETDEDSGVPVADELNVQIAAATVQVVVVLQCLCFRLSYVQESHCICRLDCVFHLASPSSYINSPWHIWHTMVVKATRFSAYAWC